MPQLDKPVGIDTIEVYVPKLFVDISELELARGQPFGRYTKGLGTEKMAVNDVHQDAATNGAMALLNLMLRNDLEPSDIGRLYVATETGVDQSKAMNSYIVGMLEQVYGRGSFSHCGGDERKFACASGAIALYDSSNWIRARENDGKSAIIVNTDIARYPLGSSGEPTQGSGAVILHVTENPRLVALDPKVTSDHIVDEKDFFRPNDRDTAVVDGQYSNWCFLYTVKPAFLGWKEKVLKSELIKPSSEECVTDYIDFMNGHIPYPKMAEYIAVFLFRHEWKNLPRWKAVIDITGSEPPHEYPSTVDALLTNKTFVKSYKEFRKKFVQTSHFKKVFYGKVNSSLAFSGEIGNIYTGSLFLGTYSLFYREHKNGNYLSGKRILFVSYGSGSTAVVFSGIIQPGYSEVVKKFDLEEKLNRRKKIRIEDYENLHEYRLGLDESIIPPHEEFALIDVGKERATKGYRYYQYFQELAAYQQYQ